nr:mechanosensitive ion channel family protein [Kineosporia rhizophila]
MARRATELNERRRQRAKAIASLLAHLTSAALVVAGVLIFVSGTGLSRAGVFTAGLLGVIAAVSVQGLAKDIVAGLFVLVEDTYGIGDYVDTTFGAAGVVEEIGLRTTRLRGKDGTIWHVRHSEVARLGNRTQAQTHLTLDIRAGFPDSPESALPPTAAGRLAAAERVVRMSLDRLDRDLASAAGENPIDRGEVPGTLVEILPVLVPRAPRKALAALAAATSSADLVDTQPLALAPGTLDDLERLGDMLEDAQVPVLTRTVLNGLINAGDDHVVLRVTGRVADTSLEQALAVLRRRLYLDLNTAGFTASFSVPKAEEL